MMINNSEVMKKISKLISCIALLVVPRVAFPVITRAGLNYIILEANKKPFRYFSYADVGSRLIHEGVEPGDPILAQIKDIFDTMLKENNFVDRKISANFFNNLMATLKEDKVFYSFVQKIKCYYNWNVSYLEMLGQLRYNEFDSEGGNLHRFLEDLDDKSLKHIRVLVEYFQSMIRDQEIWQEWIGSEQSSFPEMLFFKDIRRGNFPSIWMDREDHTMQNPTRLPPKAWEWCCDCSKQGSCCLSFVVLRVLVLNPDLIDDFLCFLNVRNFDPKHLRSIAR